MVQGLGPRQQYQENRGAMPVLRGSANVHVLGNLECHVCAFTSELLSLPVKAEEEGLAVYVLCKSCM